MVRAVGPGDGDGPVLDSYGVFAVHGEFLVDGKVHGLHRFPSGGDPGEPGLLLREKRETQRDADGTDDREKDDPVFRLQGYIPPMRM